MYKFTEQIFQFSFKVFFLVTMHTKTEGYNFELPSKNTALSQIMVILRL